MAYKHILIAVDLSPESKVLVEKAVSMARPYNAKVSLSRMFSVRWMRRSVPAGSLSRWQ